MCVSAMARLKRSYGAATILMLALSVTAQQDSDDLSQLEGMVASKVESFASSITPGPDVTSAISALLTSAASTNDVPLSLFSQGLQLLSSYFPSTTLTGIQSLSWPGTIVIGSSTYTLSPSQSSRRTTSLDTTSRPELL